MSEQCAFCDSPATRWCDYCLGFTVAGWSGCDGEMAMHVGRFDQFVPGKGLPCVSLDKKFTDTSSEMFTCDAPLCEAHAKTVGFLCGRSAKSLSDTIDYCPVHQIGRGDGLQFLTAEEAERVRLETWKMKLIG